MTTPARFNHRILWRFAIAACLLLVAVPALLWIGVDRAGRKAWEKAQAELRADGEAARLADLPAPPPLADEDNYGAIPILDGIAMAEGSGSSARDAAARRERFELILPERRDASVEQPPVPHPRLPPMDLEAWAEWLWLNAAAERRFPPWRTRNAVHLPPNSADPGGDAATRILAFFAHSDPLLEPLGESLDRSGAWFTPPIAEQEWDFPSWQSMAHVNGIRHVAHVLGLRAIVNARLKRGDEALADLKSIARLTEATANERNLAGYWVSAQMLLILETGVAEGLRSGTWDNHPEALRSCVDLLNRVRLDDTAAYVVRNEVVRVITTIGGCATETGRRYLARDGLSLWTLQYYPLPRGWFQNQQAFYADLANRHLFPALRAQADFGDLIDAGARFDAALGGLSGFQAWNQHLLDLWKMNVADIHFLPALSEAYRRQAIIACSIRRYQLAHEGRLPDSLDALVPVLLDAAPRDPIDGAAMRYKLQADDNYRLWSIGLDRSDEGGVSNLRPDHPERTKLDHPDYRGDWLWPSQSPALPNP